MRKLETICLRGHVEHVEPAGTIAGVPHFGASIVCCQRVLEDGTTCEAAIQNVFFPFEDEAVRPGPDDSVAPGLVMKLDAAAPGAADEDLDEPMYPADAFVPAGLVPRLLRARAFLLHHPALIVGAALASLLLTTYFAATGHPLLALLV